MKHALKDRLGRSVLVGDKIVFNDGGFLTVGTVTELKHKSGRVQVVDGSVYHRNIRDISTTVRLSKGSGND